MEVSGQLHAPQEGSVDRTARKSSQIGSEGCELGPKSVLRRNQMEGFCNNDVVVLLIGPFVLLCVCCTDRLVDGGIKKCHIVLVGKFSCQVATSVTMDTERTAVLCIFRQIRIRRISKPVQCVYVTHPCQ